MPVNDSRRASMAGKEHAGVEFADADLFEGAAWFFTPLPGQNVHAGLCGELSTARRRWRKNRGRRSRRTRPHLRLDQPSAADDLHRLAATLVDEFGPDAPVLDIGGRALREMTRISGSPYSMWRDIAITTRRIWPTRCINSNNASPTSRKSGLEATGGRIRARPRVEKNSATETCRQGEEQE